MLMVANVGNTRIAFGLFDGKELVENWSIRTVPQKTADEYSLLMRQLFEMRDRPLENIDATVMASVVPAVEAQIEEALSGLSGGAVLTVTHRTPLGIRNLYERPEEVGADRLANAVGAVALCGAPSIVADLGTAATLDLVSPEGDYIGGAILPGPEIAAQALFDRTAKLPRVAPKRPATVVGKTTVAAIRSGLFWGFVSAIDGMIERIRAEIGGSWPVVATGGQARIVAEESRHIEQVEPHLTLHGLRVIWERNQDS